MLKIAPTLTLENANAVLANGLQAIAAGAVEFDLAPLQTVDSSAVATLLAWQRAAQARGSQLRLLNLPANLRSLLDLYGVAELVVIQ